MYAVIGNPICCVTAPHPGCFPQRVLKGMKGLEIAFWPVQKSA